MTNELMQIPAHWVWMSLGLVLGIAEIIAPGFYLIWIGLAAILTGLIAFTGMGLVAQFLCFAVLTVLLIVAARRWFKDNPIETTDPLLNDRIARMVGETVTVVEPIEGGSGRVRVGDSVWTAYGADAAIGTKLRITGKNEHGGLTVGPA